MTSYSSITVLRVEWIVRLPQEGCNRKCILVTNDENDHCHKICFNRLKSAINQNGFIESLKFHRIREKAVQFTLRIIIIPRPRSLVQC